MNFKEKVLSTDRQATIRKEVSFSGKGFMLDKLVNVTLAPAEENSGICFTRTDIEGAPRIKACPENLAFSPNCTTLKKGEARVIVVEHLMASLWAMGITNLEVRMDGAEVPTFDGSAMPFLEILREAGTEVQDAWQQEIRIRTPLAVREDDEKCLIAMPSEDFRIGYVLRYPENTGLGTDFLVLKVEREAFMRDVFPARTFIPEEEARRLLSEGVIKSTDESMGVVVRAHENPELRLPQEFARHKILDMLGDLFVLGMKVRGYFLGIMSGHRLNARLVKALYARYP